MGELRAAWDRARSIESIPENAGKLIYIGKRIMDDRVFLFYQDASGNYWYKTRIITENGIVSEYEAIFGRKEKRR